MRLSFLFILLAAGSVSAQAQPTELVTAPDAVLCLNADSLGRANERLAARSHDQLRNLGCLRSPAGVPATLLSGSQGEGVWSVRFRPEGMSDGVTLWGRPSAFTLPGGTPLPSVRAER